MEFELVGLVGEALRTWRVPEGETKVGRNTELAISLADRSVSREHALLVRSGDQVTVQDLGSRNGTSINGDRIQARREVRAGDQIAFGNVVLTLNREAAPVQPSLSEHARLDSTVKLEWEEVRNAPSAEVSKAAGPVFDVISNLGEFLVRHQPMQEIYDACLAIVDRTIPYQRASLLLLDDSGDPVVKAARYKGGASSGALALSRTMVDTVIHERASLLVRDAMRDDRFNVAQSVILEQIRSAPH